METNPNDFLSETELDDEDDETIQHQLAQQAVNEKLETEEANFEVKECFLCMVYDCRGKTLITLTRNPLYPIFPFLMKKYSWYNYYLPGTAITFSSGRVLTI